MVMKKKGKFGVVDGVGDRLREWRKKGGLKLIELGEIINTSQGSLSDLENNKSLPSADTLSSLHRNTDLNLIWLLTDTGKMKRIRRD